MQITKVTVRVGRTVRNPLQEFSSLRADVELEAVVQDHEQPGEVPWSTPPGPAAVDQLEGSLAELVDVERWGWVQMNAGNYRQCTCGHWAGVHGHWVGDEVITAAEDGCLVTGCECGGFERPKVDEHGNPIPGVCQRCGCTHLDACVDHEGRSCAWANEERTLCTACATPEELERHRAAVAAAEDLKPEEDPE